VVSCVVVPQVSETALAESLRAEVRSGSEAAERHQQVSATLESSVKELRQRCAIAEDKLSAYVAGVDSVTKDARALLDVIGVAPAGTADAAPASSSSSSSSSSASSSTAAAAASASASTSASASMPSAAPVAGSSQLSLSDLAVSSPHATTAAASLRGVSDVVGEARRSVTLCTRAMAEVLSVLQATVSAAQPSTPPSSACTCVLVSQCRSVTLTVTCDL
jgi:hypothetical protein